MDKKFSSESIIDPYLYILQTYSLSEGLPSSKLDLLPWILSRIICHLAKSQSQGPSTLLCISQVYHCRTTISRFTYHGCLYEFLSNLCGSVAHLYEDSTIFNKLHCPPIHSFVRNYFLQNTLFLIANNFAFV